MFTVFSAYFGMMLGTLRYFFGLGKKYQDILVSHKRIIEILNIPKEMFGNVVIDNVYSININRLNFTYGDKWVFRDLNLEFIKGNMYAIVGKNGTGKSTFINLLTGLYINECTDMITYNNMVLCGIDVVQLKNKCISVAEQESFLLNDTVYYNLFLKEDAFINNDILNNLLDILNMKEFINSLPAGMDTVINDSNSNLSGGERHKLTILRVLLKNSEVMIFDEPTSALDEKSTVQFIEYLDTIKSEKIIIIVTHDLKIRNKCQVIYDLDNI